MSHVCRRCECEIDSEGGCGCNPPDAEYEQPVKRPKTWKEMLSSPATGNTYVADEPDGARKD
jgi:hypothetical protein